MKAMEDLKFKIGDIVYLITDSDQLDRIVTGLYIRSGSMTFGLSCGTNESWHYSIEISSERDILKLTQ